MPADDTTTVPATTLLGPQRTPRLDAVLRQHGLYGARVALVNAGWQERENDDDLLASLAGGNTVNLRLWQRMQDVWDTDPEFAAADRQRRSDLEESQELYLIGMEQTVDALGALMARPARTAWIHERAVQDAEQVLRNLDNIHMERVREIYTRFWTAWPPHQRPIVAAHRAALSRELADVEAVVIPGGHIGVLLGAMHLFNVAPQLSMPVIAWGAGAMAMTERIVLFHDFAVHGPAMPEVFSAGIGRVREVIALPSARERLEVTNQRRMAITARRFAPSACLLLDQGTQIEIGADGLLPPGSPVIGEDGHWAVSR